MPPVARVVRNGKEEEIPLEDVKTGDILRVKPGEKPPRAGEYAPVGPRGGRVDALTVTIDGNEGHMPPTPDNGQQWERVGPPKRQQH